MSEHKSVRNGFHLVWIEFHPFSRDFISCLKHRHRGSSPDAAFQNAPGLRFPSVRTHQTALPFLSSPPSLPCSHSCGCNVTLQPVNIPRPLRLSRLSCLCKRCRGADGDGGGRDRRDGRENDKVRNGHRSRKETPACVDLGSVCRARVSVCIVGGACVQMQVRRTSEGTLGSSINRRNVSLIKGAHLIQL